jgi:hypothetical protein
VSCSLFLLHFFQIRYTTVLQRPAWDDQDNSLETVDPPTTDGNSHAPVAQWPQLDLQPLHPSDENSEIVYISESEYDKIPILSRDFRDYDWNPETHLKYPASGSKLAMKAQQISIQRILRAAIVNFIVAICFDNAFPNVQERNKMIKDALYKAAISCELSHIVHRIATDANYVDVLSGPVRRLLQYIGFVKHANILPGICSYRPHAKQDQGGCFCWSSRILWY